MSTTPGPTDDFCYLTTTGRRSGQPHRIEIWYAAHDKTLYLLAGGGRSSDWVQNLEAHPAVEVELDGVVYAAHGRVLAGDEAQRARTLVFDKYAPRYDGDLTGWRERALPVAVDLGGRADETRTYTTMSIAEAVEAARDTEHVPVTFDQHDHVAGPFFHGTSVVFAPGDEIVPGRGSNYHDGRISNHVYFSALLEPAVWGAELAVALRDGRDRGHIYVVAPTGPFEDDPNVTNKRFPGNVTQSYRTRHPMRIVHEVTDWEGHPPEVLQGMLDNLARMRAQGLDTIED